jgi:hypothetical protein
MNLSTLKRGNRYAQAFTVEPGQVLHYDARPLTGAGCENKTDFRIEG